MFRFLIAAGFVAAVCYGLPGLTQKMGEEVKNAYASAAQTTGASKSDDVVKKVMEKAKETFTKVEEGLGARSRKDKMTLVGFEADPAETLQPRHNVFCCEKSEEERRAEYVYFAANCLARATPEQRLRAYYTDLPI